MTHQQTSRSDSGAIVIGWLTKLAIFVIVVGFLAYDGVSILTTSFSLSDRAATIANEAADNYHGLKSVDGAYAIALREAKSHGDTLAPKDFSVAPDGTVTIVLHHEASSLWMVKVTALKKWLDVKQSGSGAPPS